MENQELNMSMDKTKVVENATKKMAEMLEMDATPQLISEVAGELSQELTDDQINMICEALKQNTSESAKQLLNMTPDNPALPEDLREYMRNFANTPIEKMNSTIAVSNDGTHAIISSEEYKETEPVDVEDTIDKIFSDKKDEISEERVKDVIGYTYDLDDADTSKMFEVLMSNRRYTFDEMPKKIQDIILAGAKQSGGIPTKKILNEFTNYVINSMKTDILKDKEYDDLQAALNENFKEMSKFQNKAIDEMRNAIEDRLQNTIERISKVNKLVAARVEKKLDMYRNSYLFNNLKAPRKYQKVRGRKATLKEYLEVESKNVSSWMIRVNNRFINSSKNINDIREIVKPLEMYIDRSQQEIKEFITLLCMEIMNLKATDTADYIFIYYSISNIISLRTVEYQDQGFAKEIVDGVVSVIDYINEH